MDCGIILCDEKGALQCLDSPALRLLGGSTAFPSRLSAQWVRRILLKRGAKRLETVDESTLERISARIPSFGGELPVRDSTGWKDNFRWEAFKPKQGVRQIQILFLGEQIERTREAAIPSFGIAFAEFFDEQTSAVQVELRKLARGLLEASEQERRRIASEIHDDLGQVLALLNAEIGCLGTSGRRRRPSQGHGPDGIDRIKGLAENALEAMRRAIVGLCPPVLKDLGLTAAVAWQTGAFEKATKIQCLTKLETVDPVAQSVAVAAFRVLQESLTNIVRHAGATRVEIRLWRTRSALMLAVKDNGNGLEKDSLAFSQSGRGISGMKERAWALGGRVEIRHPTQGTHVRLTLPLRLA